MKKSVKSTKTVKSFKPFREPNRSTKTPAKKDNKPWAVYNKAKGVIFAKQTRTGPCFAAEVDPRGAQALVKAIVTGKEKGIFKPSFRYKTHRER